ncbi:MAG: 4-hydroxythreonine-4-phosphate dehydrogenase PdxA [Candidatus Omnitrophica bacterium]|nr:4-hydroxythreonine-4-phosphate dehydrogenase PdxA [Candidatus Omnitrophota bacterium]MDD5042836.1 4-hydroxythreonine-4-phosphate dehydrogenase PdxA [Candidatus Omnitrophota bacterium]MDD5501416.1 4-hydroxythreonine-4-phosphate dehydrogenase PdxA [Candidatus Omnitrophota bacterium]
MNSKNTPTLKSSTIRVGLTIGDPYGIGPIVALKALRVLGGSVRFTVIGDSFVLDRAAKAINVKSPFASPGGHPMFDFVDLRNVKKNKFSFGRTGFEGGKACFEYLDAATGMLSGKNIDCLVTCPISKEAIRLAGSKFTGHTEYLADRFGKKDTVMMLLNRKLNFSLFTRHLPIKRVSREITCLKLRDHILNTLTGLRQLFSMDNPRVVVCGLNPHASDNGLIGDEELKAIAPAVTESRKRCGRAVIEGPFAADAAISMAAKNEFDCVIALYHDQALIPLKLTGFDSGVNLTLGLPFVRTSPLHGTAFGLASSNPAAAEAGSLISSIKLAIKCALNLKKA